MSRASCIYTGTVVHRRRTPVDHAFRFPLFLLYLDLEELPGLFEGRWFWSARRPAPARFLRRDYLGDPEQPLDDAVRDLVRQRCGFRPAGPVRLLTHLRYFGYGFNPVRFYYCHDESEQLVAVVAEVTNTPWNERHCYVLPGRVDPASGRFEQDTPKRFHVSPFLEMGLDYHWSLNRPGASLNLSIACLRDEEPVFDAALSLRRREISGAALNGMLLRYPWITAQVIAAIHWQALRLWWKGVPFRPHPRHLQTASRRIS